MGLDLDYFWSLSITQLKKHISAFNRRRDDDTRIQDQLNHILGQYVGIAFGDGSKYPKKPLLQENKETPKKQTDDDFERFAKEMTIKMGGKVVE